MDYYRKIERSVTISADKRSTVDLQVDVWSADANITKFILKLDTADSTAIDLTDATVTTALVYDGVILQDNGQVEEVATQRISYVLNERLRGYEGVVNGGFYVTLKTGQKIDIQNVSFNMCKSLIDTDLEPARENAYATFDTITNDVKDYADVQKGNIDGVVADVKSTGNTAKTQIGQVLPDVQSKVAAINTELAKIDANMPDLFVAYADDINGSGFSKTDNTKLYKGSGVKNSNLPADYRWERNVDNLSVGGENLIINGGFPTDTHGWKTTSNISFYVHKHSFYYNENKNIFCITNQNVGEGYVSSDRFKVKRNTNYTISFVGFSGGNVKSTDVVFLSRKNGEDADYTSVKMIFKDIKMNQSSVGYYRHTFNTGDNDECYIRFDHNGSTDGQVAHMFFGEVTLVEGNTAKRYQFSSADMILASNPINSILTTLSSENPSTTLGGTWTQLGTESKFNQTIYYWKRTN